MKHHVTKPDQVGLFVLDGTEKVSEVRDAVAARRAEIDALEQAGELAPKANGRPAWEVYKPRKWPTFATYPHKMWRPYKEPKTRPGDGTLKHEATVAAAVALCEKHGLQFWALAPRGYVWAITAHHEYVLLSKSGHQERWLATEPREVKVR